MKDEGDGNTNYNWRTWKGDGKVGNWMTNRDHPNYNTVELGRITVKTPGGLRRLALSLRLQ